MQIMTLNEFIESLSEFPEESKIFFMEKTKKSEKNIFLEPFSIELRNTNIGEMVTIVFNKE